MICLLVVVFKLIVVQVVDHSKYRKKARGHLEDRRELLARRGSILDRNHELIAVDLIHYSLAVKPHLLDDPLGTARTLARHLNESAPSILKQIRSSDKFVYIEHRLSPQKVEPLKDLKLKGLIFEKKFSRYYPYGKVGSQLVGYCDYDNAAKAGLELEYDDVLNGKPGATIYLRDALGNQFPNLDFPTSKPIDGMNVQTTIDMVYQSVLEEELRKTVEGHKAENGSAVLLNPRSGEVLGMANYPGFNPNDYNKFPLHRYRNLAITDMYEPGSTFKMVALAYCLEQLDIDLENQLVYCENGRYQLAQKVVEDHKKFAYLTARGVFENSSNIGVIKLARKFDSPLFYRYVRDFGFGAPTGIDLPAEASGILHKPGEFSSYSVNYMSIGYEVAVTPLQLAAAYGAIANNGMLMQPYVVQKVFDQKGNIHRRNTPQEIRQVITAQAAERMKKVLHGVVTRGTGTTANVSGIEIAGKTGTAQKINPETKSYHPNKHVASFVGFFPLESPRFVLLVVINNPKLGYYGSQVAAPAFKNITQRIIGLPDKNKNTTDEIVLAQSSLPSLNNNYMIAVEGMELMKAKKILDKRNIKYNVVGDGHLVYKQDPSPYSDLTNTEVVKLYTQVEKSTSNNVMPRLTGLSLKEALQALSDLNVNVEVKGSGIVVKQLPGAGKKVTYKTKIRLVCNPT
ncbi:PASTA domain-containing protein [Candidatus Saccharibacteria bacterium]|nr:PASTA domain-containing protein [Candidatus Saccharibacteria bacterium]